MIPLKVRSMVGLIPLFAVELISREALEKLPSFRRRLSWFVRHRPGVLGHLDLRVPDEVGSGIRAHGRFRRLPQQALARLPRRHGGLLQSPGLVRHFESLTVEYGTDFDVALITNFLHHFDRSANVAFLRKVAAALAPGGRVVVLEFVPNEDRVTPPMAARFGLTMLATTLSGEVYTFSDLSGMLHEAGFRDATAHPLEGPQTVVLAAR